MPLWRRLDRGTCAVSDRLRRNAKLNLLHETIAFAASLLFLLQLYELELAKRLKDIGEIFFCDREVNVANIQTVEWDARILRVSTTFGVACLTILFCLCELDDDRNAKKFLACKLQSFLN